MDSKTLVSRLAKQMDCDVRVVNQMVNAFAAIVRERGAELDSIAIPGFGNFVAMKKPEHIVFDSNSGKRMLMPPQIKVEFVAGSKLKRIVANE